MTNQPPKAPPVGHLRVLLTPFGLRVEVVGGGKTK